MLILRSVHFVPQLSLMRNVNKTKPSDDDNPKKLTVLPEVVTWVRFFVHFFRWKSLSAEFSAEFLGTTIFEQFQLLSVWSLFYYVEPMLWLKKKLPKNSAKNSAFSAQNKAKLWKILIVTLVFEKNRHFFAENCKKTQTILIIASTPGLWTSRFCLIINCLFVDGYRSAWLQTKGSNHHTKWSQQRFVYINLT
jgi:hypothetical protein